MEGRIRDTITQSNIIQGLSQNHVVVLKGFKTAKPQTEALKAAFDNSNLFTKFSKWRRLVKSKFWRKITLRPLAFNINSKI